jgi:hypothetical protein
VQLAIDDIRRSWSGPGVQAPSTAPGWNALFDALQSELRSYAAAANDNDRLEAVKRVEAIASTLSTVAWEPAAKLQQEVEDWLRPRLRLAAARRMVTETVSALPPTPDPKLQVNRARWVDFVQNELGTALRAYDAADTVSQRRAALARIHQALDSLKERNRTAPWQPSAELEAAVGELFNQRNIELAADVPTVAPFFERTLIVTGPVTRKGYTSQVTAGPKTGFGLLQSDDGIAFFNRQQYVSVTPIWDFQNQIASNPQGQRVTKLYQFSATTYDWAELTVTTILRGTGLDLSPSYQHNIDAAIASQPTCEGGFGRAIAGLIGLNQQAINQRVYAGAIGRFRSRIPAEALEEGQERIAVEQERRNAELRSKLLAGDGAISIRGFLLSQLWLRSRPDAALVSALFQVRDAPGQHGADGKKPARLISAGAGVTAYLHLGSLLSSAAAGVFQNDEVRSVRNVMIVTRDVPDGTPPEEAFVYTRNVDFPTFAKAVADTRQARSSKVTAVRITRPQTPPEFSTDARGFLVATVQDLQIEVPAPSREARGGPLGPAAQIYRITIPSAEIALSYHVDVMTDSSLRVRGKVEELTPGPNVQVWAIDRDETKPVSLSRFSAAATVTAMIARVHTLPPIDRVIDQSKLPGFTIRSVSPLDPSGWLRLSLVRNPDAPPPTIGQR